VGIASGDLKKLAEDAMKQTRLLVNNPREVTFDDALAIYTEAFGNRAAA
ncbi:MAG TPA: alcohol dehydrogenase, partial [Bradyrhizobium sp.]|nr:alcohol dehydrogenase [Bradyrhizobium sp.]